MVKSPTRHLLKRRLGRFGVDIREARYGCRNGGGVLEVDTRHYVIHIQHDAGQMHHIMRGPAMKSLCLIEMSAKDLH